MTGCCTLPPREAPAIPLWINGRPVLAMPLAFHEIRDAASQRLIRRVPLVDAALAASAVTSASQTAPLAADAGARFLEALDEALRELTAHFAGLSAVETGTHLDAGKADVANAQAVVQRLQTEAAAGSGDAPTTGQRRATLALAGPGMPLSAAVSLVLPVVLSGGAVTLLPAPASPSCALALAELCSQSGLPDGLFNVVYVSDAVAASLVRDPAVGAVRLFGPSAWAQRWQTAAQDWTIPSRRLLP